MDTAKAAWTSASKWLGGFFVGPPFLAPRSELGSGQIVPPDMPSDD